MTPKENDTPPPELVLKRLTPENIAVECKDPVDPTALQQARAIVDEVLLGGGDGGVDPDALRRVALRLRDLSADQADTSLLVQPEEMESAYKGLPENERTALHNVHGRIKAFAEAQRRSIVDMEIPIPGGTAGHTVSPCNTAGCYAPGGRYPLPSSVLMTAVTARAAGCQRVVLASPNPAPATLAAAYVAGVDIFLRIGGAQSIAAMAHGCASLDLPRCDVIVGPGNKWVTAAKSIVSGRCGIDMLAGPSEVLVICDEATVLQSEGNHAEVVAADLIAQAEHDVVARAILVTESSAVVDAVESALRRRLATLPEPNRSTAMAAMSHSFAVLCSSTDECVKVSDAVAPEHLEIMTVDAVNVGRRCQHYGGLFLGTAAAEVLGDYGAGPNHTLPTGGTGRYTGGLCVMDFLRVRTWMKIDRPAEAQAMVDDTVCMARMEGLEGHARAAELRKTL